MRTEEWATCCSPATTWRLEGGLHLELHLPGERLIRPASHHARDPASRVGL
jgi:hypothetical protein